MIAVTTTPDFWLLEVYSPCLCAVIDLDDTNCYRKAMVILVILETASKSEGSKALVRFKSFDIADNAFNYGISLQSSKLRLL